MLSNRLRYVTLQYYFPYLYYSKGVINSLWIAYIYFLNVIQMEAQVEWVFFGWGPCAQQI